METILKIETKAHGENSRKVATALNNLAAMKQQQGKADEAAPLFERAHAIKLKAYGEGHHKTATSFSWLAEMKMGQGKLDEAEELYQKSLTINLQKLGSNHIKVEKTYVSIARAKIGQGNAMMKATQLMSCPSGTYDSKDSLPPELPYDSASSSPWSICEAARRKNVTLAQTKFDEAEHLYRRSLTMKTKRHGHNSMQVAKAISAFALLKKDRGKLEEAMPMYEKAIAILRKNKKKKKHANTAKQLLAKNLNILANAFHEQGRLEEAITIHKQSIRIWKKALGQPHLGFGLSNLATIFHQQGRMEEASGLFKQALQHFRKTRGEDSQEVDSMKRIIAEHMEQREQYQAPDD